MRKIKVSVFGGLRKFALQGEIEISLKQGTTVKELRKIIHDHFKRTAANYRNSRLVFDSALATKTQILSDEDLVDHHSELNLLPPVCGG